MSLNKVRGLKIQRSKCKDTGSLFAYYFFWTDLSSPIIFWHGSNLWDMGYLLLSNRQSILIDLRELYLVARQCHTPKVGDLQAHDMSFCGGL